MKRSREHRKWNNLFPDIPWFPICIRGRSYTCLHVIIGTIFQRRLILQRLLKSELKYIYIWMVLHYNIF